MPGRGRACSPMEDEEEQSCERAPFKQVGAEVEVEERGKRGRKGKTKGHGRLPGKGSSELVMGGCAAAIRARRLDEGASPGFSKFSNAATLSASRFREGPFEASLGPFSPSSTALRSPLPPRGPPSLGPPPPSPGASPASPSLLLLIGPRQVRLRSRLYSSLALSSVVPLQAGKRGHSRYVSHFDVGNIHRPQHPPPQMIRSQ